MVLMLKSTVVGYVKAVFGFGSLSVSYGKVINVILMTLDFFYLLCFRTHNL